MLVLSYTVSEILQLICAPDPPLFNPNFGGVPVAPDRTCLGQQAHLKLFGREIIFEQFQPM